MYMIRCRPPVGCEGKAAPPLAHQVHIAPVALDNPVTSAVRAVAPPRDRAPSAEDVPAPLRAAADRLSFVAFELDLLLALRTLVSLACATAAVLVPLQRPDHRIHRIRRHFAADPQSGRK